VTFAACVKSMLFKLHFLCTRQYRSPLCETIFNRCMWMCTYCGATHTNSSKRRKGNGEWYGTTEHENEGIENEENNHDKRSGQMSQLIGSSESNHKRLRQERTKDHDVHEWGSLRLGRNKHGSRPVHVLMRSGREHPLLEHRGPRRRRHHRGMGMRGRVRM
jgi:hypothetical protein